MKEKHGKHYHYMLNKDDDCIEYHLGRLIRVMGKKSRHFLEQGNTRLFILTLLNDKGSLSQKQLMEYLDMKSSSLSELISKMADEGDIVKQSNPDDKRVTLISISAQGKELLEKKQQETKENMIKAFACLSEQEKQTLQTLLSKLMDNWSEQFPWHKNHQDMVSTQ